MNITKNNLDDLSAILTVQITPEDYQIQVEKTLQDYRKKVNIPGFRKGMVPAGLIKKRYGETIKFEEINNILQNAVNQYITDEKIAILGQPLAVPIENFDLKQDTFSFAFEIGLSPDFELNTAVAVEKFNIVIEEKNIDDVVEKFRNDFGKSVEQESVTEDTSLINVTLYKEKLDEKNSISSGKIDLKKVKDSFKNTLQAKKLNESFTINAKEIYTNLEDFFAVFHLEQEIFDEVKGDFLIEISGIYKVELAALNEKLYEEAFNNAEIKTEADFRARIKSDYEKDLEEINNNLYTNNIFDVLVKENSFDLPKNFLIKFLMQTSEKKTLTLEEATENYEKSENDIRYKLILNDLTKKYDLKVDYQDLINKTKENMTAVFKQYGIPTPSDEDLNEFAIKRIKETNHENLEQLSNSILAKKIIEKIQPELKITEKTISLDDFFNSKR